VGAEQRARPPPPSSPAGLTGAPSPWAELYDATRINPSRDAVQDFVKENANVAKRFVGRPRAAA
jgi:hypothetical protein